MSATLVEPDRRAITLCLSTLFAKAPPGVVSLRAFYDDKKGDPPFRIVAADLDGRGIEPVAEAAYELAREAAACPRPVVLCPPVAVFASRTGADTASLRAGLVLVIELDERPEAGLALLRDVLGRPTLVLASGGVWISPAGAAQERRHAYWRLREPATSTEDLDRLRRALRLMCRVVGSGADTSATSPVHPLRLGGSVHRKDLASPRLCRVLERSDAEVGLGEALAKLEAAIPPDPEPPRGAARSNSHAPGEDPFRAINDTALADLATWVPELLPKARYQPGTKAWRLSSRDLGRDNQEDLSLAPDGIVDFGVWDLGDPRRGRRTPIDTVIEHSAATTPLEAARWLAERLGIPFVGSVGARGIGFSESRDDPPKGKRPFVGSVGDEGGETPGGEPPWPDPEPLGADLPPVDALDPLLLPASLRPWVADAARRMQAPPEFVTVPTMVAAGSLIGRKVGIRPKRADDWLVVPNLWGAIVGRPGQLKTPAAQAGLDPLHRLEREAAARFREEARHAEADKAVGEALRKAREKDLAARIKAEESRESMVAWLAEIEDPPAPARRRYVVNDATVEKLGELLRDNPNGLLCYRDELAGWLRTMAREGHENDRAFLLEAWTGTGSYTSDRIGRGTVEIDHAILSVVGSIQPGPLLAYLGAIRRGGVGDDGLLQRLQLLVWPDSRSSWEDVDVPPDAGARTKAYEAFAALDGLDAAAFGATAPVGAGIPFVRFDAAAQERFVAWRAGLEARLLSAELPTAVEAHLAKYRSLVPSLALISQALDHGKGPVRDDALVRALAWAAYLEGHARRVYHVLFHGDRTAAELLGKRLRAGALADGFTLRDVQRKDWASLTDRETIQAGLALLEECGWIRSRVEGTGGRPRRTYAINPKLKGAAS